MQRPTKFVYPTKTGRVNSHGGNCEDSKHRGIEKKIENTKDIYYDALERADYGWHEEKNDPTPFIRYMLKVILACYTEFEERVGIVEKTGVRSSACDVVKAYISGKVGK